MAEKTFTADEVAEVLELMAVALDQGAKATVAMLNAVPGLAKVKTPQEWIRLYAEAIVKQVREIAKLTKSGQ